MTILSLVVVDPMQYGLLIPRCVKTEFDTSKDKIIQREPGQDPLASDYNTSKYIVHNLNVIRRNYPPILSCSVLLGIAKALIYFFLKTLSPFLSLKNGWY